MVQHIVVLEPRMTLQIHFRIRIHLGTFVPEPRMNQSILHKPLSTAQYYPARENYLFEIYFFDSRNY